MPPFLIALMPLLVGTSAGAYFTRAWFMDERRPPLLLYWTFGLGLLWWFKVPNVLLHAGIPFVQQELYPFLFVTLLLYFVGHLFLLRAMFSLCGGPNASVRWYVLWGLLAALYFFFTFFVEGSDVTYAPVWGSNLLFFMPAQLLMLYALRQAAHHRVRTASAWLPGTFSVAAGLAAFLIASAFYILIQVAAYPNSQWYLAAISSPSIAMLQALGTLFLFIGARKLTRVVTA